MRYDQVDWVQAACNGVGESFYYIEDAEVNTYLPILRKICNDCPILSECAGYAIEHERHGFWGGLTARQRGQVRAGTFRAA